MHGQRNIKEKKCLSPHIASFTAWSTSSASNMNQGMPILVTTAHRIAVVNRYTSLHRNQNILLDLWLNTQKYLTLTGRARTQSYV